MAIFPLAPDQTIAQMWSNGVEGGGTWSNLQVATNNFMTLANKQAVKGHGKER